MCWLQVRRLSRSDLKGPIGASVEPKDFDDKEMQDTFEQIRSRLTRVQDGQIDSIAATCKQMSDQEAAEVADFIFSLFLRISEKHHSSS